VLDRRREREYQADEVASDFRSLNPGKNIGRRQGHVPFEFWFSDRRLPMGVVMMSL
jgi:hypothetical protein